MLGIFLIGQMNHDSEAIWVFFWERVNQQQDLIGFRQVLYSCKVAGELDKLSRYLISLGKESPLTEICDKLALLAE